ncbi:MAG: LysM peptidoglycan-binding domain-containing protein [Bacillota bacterium]|jgi:LysM repeat protein
MMKKLSCSMILGLLLAFVSTAAVLGDDYQDEIQLSSLAANEASHYTYVVQPGDNLKMIAESFCTTVQKLITMNKLSNPNKIYVGQELKVRSIEKIAQPVIYTVKPSETLSQIAKKHGLTINEIINANQLQNPNKILIGQKIIIPAKMGQTPSPTVKNDPKVQTIQNIYTMYLVKAGDTLYKVARDNNTTVNNLIQVNNIDPDKYLFVGQKLFIPMK